MAKNCWYKKGNGATDDKDDEGANLAREDSNDSNTIVQMVVVSNKNVDSKTWFLDTGCLNHMHIHRTWLVGFDDTGKRKIRLVDSS